MKKIFTVYVFLVASLLVYAQESDLSQGIDQIITLENGTKIRLTGGGGFWENGRGAWRYLIEFVSVVDALHIKIIYRGEEIVLPIDPQELSAPMLDQPFGKEAKAWTEQYMKQPVVKITLYRGGRGRAKKISWASLSCGGKADFEKGILSAGLAWINPDSGHSYNVNSQDAARVNLRGIWADPTPPWERYAKK